MKKLLALGATAAGLTVGVSALLQKALVSRSLQMPESLERLVSGCEEPDAEFVEIGEQEKQWMEDRGLERHEITNCEGYKLKGYLLRPKTESDVFVFACHGYRSDGIGEWCRFARFYVEEMGYNLFFVDHQAHGESEGKVIGFGSFESRDAIQWLGYLTENYGDNIKIILHGISMGSATVMLMTGNESLPANVRFTIADCGYTSAIGEFTYKMESWKMPKKPLLPLACAINKLRGGYDFAKDTDALSAVSRAKIPMLFVHGDKDNFVPTYMVYLLYHDCPTEKDLLIVEGADHAESYKVAPDAYEAKIKAFAEKYL